MLKISRAALCLRPGFRGLTPEYRLDDDGKSFWVLRMKVRDRIVPTVLTILTLMPAMWVSICKGGSERHA